MRRFYAPPESFNHEKAVLNSEETRHLRDVLRLREGGEIKVFDGAGKEFLCRIFRIEKDRTNLEILSEIEPAAPESPFDLTLAAAILKGEKFDLVVQKACEIGVKTIIPLITQRADIKIKDVKDAKKKLERWRRIVLESSKQCGRARLMQVEQPVSFEQFIKNADESFLLFSERDGENFETSFKKNSRLKKATAIIGSEGGWDDAELQSAKESSVQIITLGGRILRAETAAIIIPALLQNLFGDLK